MMAFLFAILAYPTVVFTLPLCLVIAYWLFVLLGALDIHLLGSGAEGDIDVGGDPAGHTGDADASGDGHDGSGGDGHGDDGSGHDGHGHGHGRTLTDALGLTRVPLTVSISLLLASSWLFSLLGMGLLSSLVAGPIGATLLAAAAVCLALPTTAVLILPLRGLFRTTSAKGNAALVGETCTVMTLRVDQRFGQAEVLDGGAAHLVQVRCSRLNDLTFGSQALIFDFERDEQVFSVAPLDQAIATALSAGKRGERDVEKRDALVRRIKDLWS